MIGPAIPASAAKSDPEATLFSKVPLPTTRLSRVVAVATPPSRGRVKPWRFGTSDRKSQLHRSFNGGESPEAIGNARHPPCADRRARALCAVQNGQSHGFPQSAGLELMHPGNPEKTVGLWRFPASGIPAPFSCTRGIVNVGLVAHGALWGCPAVSALRPVRVALLKAGAARRRSASTAGQG